MDLHKISYPRNAAGCGCERDNDGKNANEGLNGEKKTLTIVGSTGKRTFFFSFACGK